METNSIQVDQELDDPLSMEPPTELSSATDLDYDLPQERIAIRPIEPRSSSCLLVSDASSQESDANGPSVRDCVFRDLPSLLPSNALLVMNQSRVITARLLMNKEGTGGKAEVLCVSPMEPSVDPALALVADSGQAAWKCLIGGKKIKPGSRLVMQTDLPSSSERLELIATVESREVQAGIVRFTWRGSSAEVDKMKFGAVLEAAGKIPLPPYMNRASDAADVKDYQTVYAKAEGSVAAPTAGLHFTEELLKQLQNDPSGIKPCYLTLHVGAGTFQPVASDNIASHTMHWERVSVPLASLDQLIEVSDSGRPILPVGTTSVRTLESLYWWGADLLRRKGSSQMSLRVDDLSLGQWEPYHRSLNVGGKGLVPAKLALEALKQKAEEDGLTSVGGETQLCIAPGYRFALCDALITNFHQPRSTLLLLVGALMGGLRPIHRIYRHALTNPAYRFLSFGDSNLMIPPSRVLLPVRRNLPAVGAKGLHQHQQPAFIWPFSSKEWKKL